MADELERERDRAGFDLVAHEEQRLFDDRVEIEHHPLGRAWCRHAADALHDLARMAAAVRDAGGKLRDLGEIGLRTPQPAQAGLGIGDDRRERLVDLVRDRGGDLPQHGDPRRA